MASSSSNPDWVTDELIVTLDFYLKHRAKLPGKTSRDILGLSATLNRLSDKIFPSMNKLETFRNSNSVYMKLMNFRRLDPEFTSTGRKGLSSGAKMDELIWKEYALNPKRCAEVAHAIAAALDDTGVARLGPIVEAGEEMEEAIEGRLLTRMHLARERNVRLASRKKKKVLNASGRLACEGCGFDFHSFYGARGRGFIECHHVRPLASRDSAENTHINDLALLCANCHRMIHRERPWLSVDGLRSLLATRKTGG